MVKVVPSIAVPLTFREPSFRAYPSSGRTVRVTRVPLVASTGSAVTAPWVILPIVIVYFASTT